MNGHSPSAGAVSRIQRKAWGVRVGIMYNRTAIGVVFNSSAPCPYPEGPCSCRNGSDGTSVHTCKPWDAQRFPYGSEFAFDTTGQEEVYIWARQGSLPFPVTPSVWHACVMM